MYLYWCLIMVTIERTREGVTTIEEVGESISEFTARKKKEISARRKEKQIKKFRKEVAEAEAEGISILRTAKLTPAGDIIEQTVTGPSGAKLIEKQFTRTRAARPRPVQEFAVPEVREVRAKAISEPFIPSKPMISKGEEKAVAIRKAQEFTSSFMEGFTFQPTAEQRVRGGTGLEAAGFTLGSTAAIGAKGISKLVGIGLKPIPFISPIAVAAESFFAKKPVQLGLAGAAGVGVGITAVTEGQEAAVRQSANLARDVAAFGGLIKGAKPKTIKGDFIVNTFQDTAVIRGSGTIKGQSFTETTTTTDLGKTSNTQINIGGKIFLIERTPEVTKVKVVEANTFKTLQSFETEPSVTSIKSRISDIRKQPVERVAEIEAGLFAKSLTKQVQTAKAEGFGVGALGERVSLDLSLKKISETTVVASKPQRSIDEFVKQLDLDTGVAGIVKKPRLREVGRVEFVEEDVPIEKDILSIKKADEGFFVEKIAKARPVTAEQFFQIGRGRLELETFEPMNLFKSKRAELALPLKFPQETFIEQVGIPQPVSKFRPLEFTPTISTVSIKEPFSFVTLPSKPIIEKPVLIPKTIEPTISEPKFIPVSDIKPVQVVEPFQVVEPAQQFIPISVSKPKTKPVSLVKPVQVVEPVQIPDLSLVPSVPVEPVPISPFFPRRLVSELPIRPKLPTIPFFAGISQPLFDVEVGRIGRKFFFEQKDLTLKQAIAFGRKGVKETAAATLRITPSDDTDIRFLSQIEASLGGEFRRGKDEDVFVQKRRFRIGTVGEKEDITLLGLEALKRKDLKSLF